ncbi:HET-domain-containing protein, partial [Corynespora cassiicola Philippines]
MVSITIDDHDRLYGSLPLNPPSNEIRLLRILPGQDDQMVVCTLKSVSLDDEPFYEALSYHWGDPGICRPVIVYSEKEQRNCMLDVTRNLEAALRHLRFPGHSRTIWIDAICINQRDLDEKFSQIPLMRKIYALATEVIVWLGESDQDSKMAMDHVRGLTFFLNPTREMLHAYDFVAHRQLLSFIRKSWWERAWIIQEATVGK